MTMKKLLCLFGFHKWEVMISFCEGTDVYVYSYSYSKCKKCEKISKVGNPHILNKPENENFLYFEEVSGIGYTRIPEEVQHDPFKIIQNYDEIDSSKKRFEQIVREGMK